MKKRVLIVDDEPDVNLAVKTALEQNDYKVDAFKDPLLALEDFRKGLYDLLILDIKMIKKNNEFQIGARKKRMSRAKHTMATIDKWKSVILLIFSSTYDRYLKW
jgi:DNA-binding response OmpR family regulator